MGYELAFNSKTARRVYGFENGLRRAMIARMGGADGKAPVSAQRRLPASNPRSTERIRRKGRVLAAIGANDGTPISVLAKASNVLVSSTADYVRELTDAGLITSDIQRGVRSPKRICMITAKGREVLAG